MRPEIQAKLQQIKNVSIFFRVICKVLLALITLTGVGCVVSVAFGVGGVNYDNAIFGTAGLTLGHRLVLGAVAALTWAILFKCLYHLHQLFGNYSRGEIFTRESVGHIRQFGIACLLWGFMGFLWIASLAVAVHTAKTFHGHADSFVIGAVIIAIAWFMDMAVDLSEENELTI